MAHRGYVLLWGWGKGDGLLGVPSVSDTGVLTAKRLHMRNKVEMRI